MEEAYYQETDPKKRGEILNNLLLADSGEMNQYRKELYEYRYVTKGKGKNSQLVDRYLELFIIMKIAADNGLGLLGVRRTAKELKQLLEQLGINRFMKLEDTARTLLYQEFYHTAAYYITSGQRDSCYKSALFGTMTLSDQMLQRKFAKDICKVARIVPQNTKLVEPFALFTEAVEAALYAKLPGIRGYYRDMTGKN